MDTDSSQLIKNCGSNIPAKITSTGNKLTVNFKSDASITLKGFKATWNEVMPASVPPDSCGNCEFPFIYGGRIHHRCTTIDGDPKPWCIAPCGKEYCEDPNCPGLSASTTEQMTVNPANEVGSCCKNSIYRVTQKKGASV